ncbi:MAG: type II toxin-antitoxin system RelE/ParE family toxin [Rhodospirillales bacterium]|nr:type II toxin-antitoxin system RelE/ParE family toxin [Rhodospirillales bacterium]
MIKTFADKRTAELSRGNHVKQFAPFAEQARRRLTRLDEAQTIHDLMVYPSNRFEALRGDRKGQYSIRINDQWRICFRFENGDAYDVEIADYHR